MSTTRPAIRSLRKSRIREVAQSVADPSQVLPFWFGEPDAVTPEAVRAAGQRALDEGDTFYTSNFGIAPLREALAAYMGRLHGPLATERIVVTSAGVSALMVAAQWALSPGDRMVVVTPAWPNLVEIPRILGAQVVEVPLRFDRRAGWTLDLERLLDALTPDTRMVLINSPANPSGWILPAADQRVVLEHCRRQGIWILADDVYERLVYEPVAMHDGAAAGPRRAPCLLDIADPEDRLLSVNSFSKTWLMTGWRLGWLTAPASLVDDLGRLIEYNTSCAPGFVQRAGLAAIAQGEGAIRATVDRFASLRDTLFAALSAVPGIEVHKPEGGLYLFFRVEGLDDSLGFCKRLAAEAGLGLAPGSAFGDAGEGYIRWCFASSPERLREGVERFARFVG